MGLLNVHMTGKLKLQCGKTNSMNVIVVTTENLIEFSDLNTVFGSLTNRKQEYQKESQLYVFVIVIPK